MSAGPFASAAWGGDQSWRNPGFDWSNYGAGPQQRFFPTAQQAASQIQLPQASSFGSGASTYQPDGGNNGGSGGFNYGDSSFDGFAQPENYGAGPQESFGSTQGLGFSGIGPSNGTLGSLAGGLVGNAFGGPIGGALGGFLGGQATGQGLGRGAGSALGGLIGSAAGPFGGILGSLVGGWLGGQADGPSMSFTTRNDDGSALAAALGNVASTEGNWQDGITGFDTGERGPGGFAASDFADTSPAENGSYGNDYGGPSGDGGYGGGSDGGATGGASDGSNDSGGSGFAKGGYVTHDRLRGPNPAGPDDGYAALDAGEVVIYKDAVKALGPEFLLMLNRAGKSGPFG